MYLLFIKKYIKRKSKTFEYTFFYEGNTACVPPKYAQRCPQAHLKICSLKKTGILFCENVFGESFLQEKVSTLKLVNFIFRLSAK